DQLPDHDADVALEALLRRARPEPDAGWTRATERGIFAAVERRRRERMTAIGAGTGLALTVLVASLAGAGPLALDGGDAAKAKPGCEVVYETRVESVGQVVQRPDGKVVVESRKEPVQREVTRCR
ncbi:MAG: hypothetical protein JHD16_18995, partial [Solirubrobacteraceae bacterium]|nr:hypothetical protein [Solirubrobacteraceae bacterium]